MEVGEGNRLKRAGIGFGSGAMSMDLQVGISDLASPDPRGAFVVSGTAKFVLQKVRVNGISTKPPSSSLKYEQQIN